MTNKTGAPMPRHAAELLPPVRGNSNLCRIVGFVCLLVLTTGIVIRNDGLMFTGLLGELLAFVRADAEEELYA